MTELDRSAFGEHFAWGVSTAALQTEGACSADGKGKSIWDVFTSRKGRIHQNEHPQTACDFYNRYREDIDLVKELGIPNFRFSIAWTRILPSGKGEVNQAGIDHYHRVIDYCLEQGVQPWITLYHWDLPHELELKGGWTNREIVNWFSEFAGICAKNFGGKVKHWMVLNEPSVFTGAGYFLGIHAPGRTGLRNFVPAIHHAVLCMAEGGRILRNLLPADAQIGTTFSCSYIEPYSSKQRDIDAANRADALINRLFIEPVLGLGYPVGEISALKALEKYMLPGDEQKMQFDFDFIGLQNYTREIVKYSFFTPYISASLVKAKDRNVPLTEMGWEIYPASIYHIIKKFSTYPQIKKIIITENGAAFKDDASNGEIQDEARIGYLKDHIGQVLKAKEEGCPVDGYFVWTLTDNFEWAEGYRPRFGIIHIDFDTQKRTIKKSGRWYAQLLKGSNAATGSTIMTDPAATA